jgi:uncharacterized BrkB/YihY/UPF0761 family membrane protein
VFGVALTIWEVSGSVRAITGAMNRIYDTEEERSLGARFGVSILLGVAIGACLIGSVLVVTPASHLGGSLHVLVDIGRWILVVALLGIAVELLVALLPTAIVFLVGVQADELIRMDAARGERGLWGHVRAALD